MFIAKLCMNVALSTVHSLSVLWCFETRDMCFPATLADSDVLVAEHGTCIFGQWRMSVCTEASKRVYRMHFLRPALLSEQHTPAWMGEIN